MTNQKVTVVIPYSPSHTPERMLHEAIDSAKSQSVPTEIQVVRDEDQRGPAWARNQGIDRAETRYIAFLDADDIWSQRKLRRQIECLQKTNSGISVEAPHEDTSKFIQDLFLENIFSLTSSIVIDAEKVTERFNTELNRWEDHAFIIICAQKYGACFCENLVTIRKHDKGLSSESTSTLLLSERRKYHNYLSDELDSDLVSKYGDKLIHDLSMSAAHTARTNGEFSDSVRYGAQSLKYEFSISGFLSVSLAVFGDILPNRIDNICAVGHPVRSSLDIITEKGVTSFLFAVYEQLISTDHSSNESGSD